MPFIGNQPALSYTSFAVQHFTTSATTSYTLDHSVANENEIRLVINNVVQQPGSSYAYTASGTTLTLSAATSSTDTMYAVFLGKAVQTVNPPDASVSLNKLDTTAKTFLTRNYRNLIINGDMSIAQRGTSSTGLTSSSYNTLDRFKLAMNTAGTWTMSQDTDVPTGQGFAKSLKLDCTTANASLSSGSYMRIDQRLEGQNLQYLKKGTSSAESLTLSFWVKSNKTGTYICEVYDQDNTRQISKSYTISSASTWEKKTITFAGDTTGTLDNDNARSLDVYFWLAVGTDYSSGTLNTSWNSVTTANRVVGQVNLADSTSNEFYITGVQLEAGQTASEFEFLPYDVTFERCQRYFQQWVTGTANENKIPGYCRNTTLGVYPLQFKSIMRSAPTITSEYASGKLRHAYTNDTNCTSFNVSYSSVSDAHITYGASSPALVAGQGCALRFFSGGNIKVDAEL